MIEECNSILEAVDELNALDNSGQSDDLCIEVREKTEQYKLRLETYTNSEL